MTNSFQMVENTQHLIVIRICREVMRIIQANCNKMQTHMFRTQLNVNTRVS